MDYIIGWHDTVEHKPHTEPIELAKCLLGHPNIIMGVGDDINDMIAYRDAGIFPVGITLFSQDEKILHRECKYKLNCDYYIADRVEDFISFVNDIYTI